jgi:hypothetical protein
VAGRTGDLRAVCECVRERESVCVCVCVCVHRAATTWSAVLYRVPWLRRTFTPAHVSPAVEKLVSDPSLVLHVQTRRCHLWDRNPCIHLFHSCNFPSKADEHPGRLLAAGDGRGQDVHGARACA